MFQIAYGLFLTLRGADIRMEQTPRPPGRRKKEGASGEPEAL